jgi:hypothetical protein
MVALVALSGCSSSSSPKPGPTTSAPLVTDSAPPPGDSAFADAMRDSESGPSGKEYANATDEQLTALATQICTSLKTQTQAQVEQTLMASSFHPSADDALVVIAGAAATTCPDKLAKLS